MSEWGWVCKHAALDAWEARWRLARAAAGGCAALALALALGAGGWAAWGMVRLVEEGSGLVNAAPAVGYARSDACEAELAGLPSGWRFKAGAGEFFEGPMRGQEVVFACRREGGVGWIERREARGGAEDWLERVRSGAEGGLGGREREALDRLEAKRWERVEARASFRAWGEALGVWELSEASRGMASSTDAAAQGGALAWLARAALGLPMLVLLGLGLLAGFAGEHWPALGFVLMGAMFGALASDALGAARADGSRRWWGPWRLGAAGLAASLAVGFVGAELARERAPGVLAALGVAEGAQAWALPVMVASAVWLVALLGLLLALLARLAPDAARAARRALGEKAREARAAIESPQFQARAQRRELERLTRSRGGSKGARGEGEAEGGGGGGGGGGGPPRL